MLASLEPRVPLPGGVRGYVPPMMLVDIDSFHPIARSLRSVN